MAGMGAGALLALWPKAASAQDPVLYTYDALGRLTSATYPNGVTVAYSYDPADNRTQVWAGSGPPPPPPPPPPALVVGLSATTWSSLGGVEDPPVQVTATGGVPPYGYVWQRVSGNQFTQPSGGASTTWYVSGGNPNPPYKISTWRCQVTDSAGASAVTPNVSVTIDVS